MPSTPHTMQRWLNAWYGVKKGQLPDMKEVPNGIVHGTQCLASFNADVSYCVQA